MVSVVLIVGGVIIFHTVWFLKNHQMLLAGFFCSLWGQLSPKNNARRGLIGWPIMVKLMDNH